MHMLHFGTPSISPPAAGSLWIRSGPRGGLLPCSHFRLSFFGAWCVDTMQLHAILQAALPHGMHAFYYYAPPLQA